MDLCLERQRHQHSHVRRDVHAAHGYRPPAHSLQGQRAGGHRFARRPGEHDVRQHPVFPATYQIGQVARDRDHRREARPRAAGPADDRRSGRSRLRVRRLVRAHSPGGHAARDHREAQHGGAAGHEVARVREAHDRPRLQHHSQHARRDGGHEQGRDRALGADRQIEWREDRLIMPRPKRIEGVLAPVITPFKKDYSPDAERFVRHCRWLLKSGCAGLAVFGTNSEANSLSVSEKKYLLERLVDGGVPASALMPGTGHCALSDSIELTRAAVEMGCAGVLMLPPFYYKGVSDEGLYRNFAEVIERVGDERLQLYLYHIPPVAQVGISLGLIDRLLKAYPETIAGMKDSSGDWNNTKAVLDQFSQAGFDVFVGSETFLLANMRNGGKGAISATANVNPAKIAALHRQWMSSDADAMQGRLDSLRKIFAQYRMMAAMKRAVAHWSKDEDWSRVRPPLVEIAPRESTMLVEELKAAGFDMPGIRSTTVSQCQ